MDHEYAHPARVVEVDEHDEDTGPDLAPVAPVATDDGLEIGGPGAPAQPWQRSAEVGEQADS